MWKSDFKRVVDKTTGEVLAERALIANSFFLRLKGLLGKNNLAQGEALIIPNCNSIHTFFMKFSIDVMFLSKDKKVVKMVNSLKSNLIVSCIKAGHVVVELPAGTLSNSQTKLGNLIQFYQN